MADDLGADLDELVLERRQRPLLDRIGYIIACVQATARQGRSSKLVPAEIARAKHLVAEWQLNPAE